MTSKKTEWTEKKPRVSVEGWLRAAVESYREIIETAAGVPLGPYHISPGFTEAGSRDTKHGGVTFGPGASSDGLPHIFLNPRLSDPETLLAIVVHEAIHVALGVKEGHRKRFQAVAAACGMVHPFTCATWGEEGRLNALTVLKALGPYPRGQFITGNGERKKQGIRMLKAACPECGYTVRASLKWLRISLPVCGSCGVPFEAEGLDDDGEEGEGDTDE